MSVKARCHRQAALILGLYNSNLTKFIIYQLPLFNSPCKKLNVEDERIRRLRKNLHYLTAILTIIH